MGLPAGSRNPAPWQTPESHISLTWTPAASSFAFAGFAEVSHPTLRRVVMRIDF
jgi:hypothetical protein